MTTNHHTAISAGAAANASTFNTPLGTLDSAITTNATAIAANALLAATTTAEVVAARGSSPDLDARLDALVLAGGNVATKANGVSAAGQKVLAVDATDGFVVGAYVTYLLNGTTLEGNTIGSIQAGVSLTLGTNIGATPAGGVLDDSYISMISTSEYLAAQAIPHAAGTTLMLPQTMEYANGGVFNVAAYGATSGADNTAAIQAALNAANSAGSGIVDLGKFTSLISTSLTVYSNTIVRGSGAISCLKAKTGLSTGTPILKSSSGSSNITFSGFRVDDTDVVTDYAAVLIYNTDRVRINDLLITKTAMAGIHVESCSDVVITGCVFDDAGAGDSAIGIVASSYVSVSSNIIHGGGDGIAVYGSGAPGQPDCTDVSVIGNQLEGGSGIGIILSLSNIASMDAATRRVIVNGNTISSFTSNKGIGVFGGSSDCIVSGNVIYGCAGGIYVYQGQHVVGIRNLTISENIVNASTASGIYLASESGAWNLPIYGVIINDNQINYCAGAGIYVVADTQNVSNLNINNNCALNNNTSAGYSDGISLVLSNAADMSGLTLSANRCADTQSSKTQRFGLSIIAAPGTTLTNSIIVNNNFTDNLSGNVYIDNAGTLSPIWRDNIGYKTRSYGTSAAIASAATIAHGLVAAPTAWSVMPTDTGLSNVYATADATNLTITYAGGGTHAFAWTAEV